MCYKEERRRQSRTKNVLRVVLEASFRDESWTHMLGCTLFACNVSLANKLKRQHIALCVALMQLQTGSKVKSLMSDVRRKGALWLTSYGVGFCQGG